MRLASAGYCAGDPERVLQTRADLVLAMLDQERFRVDFEAVFLEINKAK